MVKNGFTLVLALALTSCAVSEPILLPHAMEIVPAGEARMITAITDATAELQINRAKTLEEQNGRVLRGVHPKSHGCATGRLQISEEIPKALQLGLLDRPGEEFSALVRFSNASARVGHDLKGGRNGSRGMAVKIYDVAEKEDVLVLDNGRANQDFLMINTPAFAFPDVRSYLRLTEALKASDDFSTPDAALATDDSLPPVDQSNLTKTHGVLGDIASRSVSSPESVSYFLAAPSSFGADSAMKVRFVPCETTEAEPLEAPPPDYLRNALSRRLGLDREICFTMQIQHLSTAQLLADRESDPEGDLIEDATRNWDKTRHPLITVGRLMLEVPQTTNPEDDIQQTCESSAYSPWHTLETHRPLGGINRLRKPVYVRSARTRLR